MRFEKDGNEEDFPSVINSIFPSVKMKCNRFCFQQRSLKSSASNRIDINNEDDGDVKRDTYAVEISSEKRFHVLKDFLRFSLGTKISA